MSALPETGMHELPETGFMRLYQIIGQEAVTEKQAKANRKLGKGLKRARPAIPPLIPIKKTCWWDGVASGRYPKPLKALGPRVSVWRVEDIRALIERAAL